MQRKKTAIEQKTNSSRYVRRARGESHDRCPVPPFISAETDEYGCTDMAPISPTVCVVPVIAGQSGIGCVAVSEQRGCSLHIGLDETSIDVAELSATMARRMRGCDIKVACICGAFGLDGSADNQFDCAGESNLPCVCQATKICSFIPEWYFRRSISTTPSEVRIRIDIDRRVLCQQRGARR